MNRLIHAALLAALLLASSAQAARVVTSFDPDWRFNKGDAPGADKPDFSDAQWRKVDVPHDWSIEGPYDQNNPSNRGGGYLPTGVSWYRKSFTLPADRAMQRVFIHFEGVMANSEVWINGHPLGKRPFGYVPLHYELTGHLNFGDGKTNILSVKTDTTQQPASRWYTGQGITRHVRLIVTDPVHVEQFGMFVTTPQAAADAATVKVQNTVINQSDAAREVVIQTTIIGPDGQAVQTASTPAQSIAAGKSAEFQQEIRVANPKLWNLESPGMYRAISKVQAGSTTLDEETSPFGIRTFEFKPESGFWLNGKNIKILGACLHHDGGAVGAAVPLRVWERRLELLRTIGVNGIRTAHNPFDPAFLDLCDRMGFVVMTETFDTWTARKNNADFGYQLNFKDWWERDTRDMVLRDRNHPSVFMISIGNEIRDNMDTPAGLKVLTDQRDLVHKLDPTRPVTMGLFRPTLNGPYLDQLDLVGVNYRPEMLAQIRQGNPARKVIDSEETHALDRWRPVRDNPAAAGIYVWTGVDYLGETGEANGWPFVVSSNASDGFGMLEHSGYFRPKAYQRQSWWSTKLMVRIVRNLGHGGTGPLVNDWTPADPDTFDAARVEVFSNCEQVELTLNDKPLQREQEGNVWRFPYEEGTLKAVGKNGGQVVATHELKTAGAPAKIVLSADRMKIANEFDDLSHVTAEIVDAKGVVNPNAEQVISFKVGGPGKIAALSTGDRQSHQPFQASERKAFHGQVIALIKSNANTGQITLTASAPGLPDATITLEAAPPTAAK